MTGPVWTFHPSMLWSAGVTWNPNATVTTTEPANATSNCVVTLYWNVRLSDGSLVVMEGATSMDAQVAVEAAEWMRPAVGLPWRRVVEVTSA